MTRLYAQLTYEEYKRLEEELSNFKVLETTHEGGEKDERFYHNSFVFHLGDITIEAHGPLVKP